MISNKLYTIGYGNKTSIEMFDLLEKYGIEKLVDIRSIPYSKYRPEFNKNRLALSAKLVGIEYIYKGDELGGKTNLNYEDLRIQPLYLSGIKYLIELLEAGYNIAIMCCEADYNNCHRYSLVGEDIFQLGYEVTHIGKKGESIPHKRLF
ncbi:DUF488 family protein [Dysgonomonas sp. 520]|uniref:DUF488 domain-containing protein n=1 Tax=Dysgonomonas sp. 520 TaxID=2302931 RepID=UPI0013D5460B|nr:DUF488 domain-containing protein [Dysgonomonas sp. 520]NDW11076.1 DUF488 domain-containing protein [Dysgonomonas sp. 520]